MCTQWQTSDLDETIQREGRRNKKKRPNCSITHLFKKHPNHPRFPIALIRKSPPIIRSQKKWALFSFFFLRQSYYCTRRLLSFLISSRRFPPLIVARVFFCRQIPSSQTEREKRPHHPLLSFSASLSLSLSLSSPPSFLPGVARPVVRAYGEKASSFVSALSPQNGTGKKKVLLFAASSSPFLLLFSLPPLSHAFFRSGAGFAHNFCIFFLLSLFSRKKFFTLLSNFLPS